MHIPQSGHTFFVQRRTPGVLAVHASYQYGDAAMFAFGKRARFRHHGLWRAPEAAGYAHPRRVLQLDDSSMAPSPADEPLSLLSFHFDSDALWRRRVMGGLALARALNRTLLLPAAACYCDRAWSPLVACRTAGAPRFPLPFPCPMDHVVNTGLWERSGVAFRGIGFAVDPRAARARVWLGPAVASATAAAAPKWDFKSEAPLSDAQLLVALRPWGETQVLHVSGPGPFLCGLSATLDPIEGHRAATAGAFHGLARYRACFVYLQRALLCAC